MDPRVDASTFAEGEEHVRAGEGREAHAGHASADWGSPLTALLAAENPGVTLIATAEDSPSTTVRPRLEAVCADLERVQFVAIQTDDGLEDGLTVPDDIETSRLALLGESPHNGRALLAMANEEERGSLDDAKEFLLGELGDGARHPASDIFKTARQHGIAERTLKTRPPTSRRQDGESRFDRGWQWWLPKGPSPTDEPAFLHKEVVAQVLAPSGQNGLHEEELRSSASSPSAPFRSDSSRERLCVPDP
jgi:hypothetical protein